MTILTNCQGKFTSDEFTFLKDKVAAKDRKSLMFINLYKKNKNEDDMIHSLQRYYKKLNP